MNAWPTRILVAGVFALTMWLHAVVTADVDNTPLGMLIFHGSAALADLALLYSLPYMLGGRLCDDMQVMCLMSAAGNALGWIAYMAYLPPDPYNACMWFLSFVQWGRLLLTDKHDADHLGTDLVRRHHIGRA